MSMIQQMALFWALAALAVVGLYFGVPLIRKRRRDAGPSYKPDKSKPTAEEAIEMSSSRLDRISSKRAAEVAAEFEAEATSEAEPEGVPVTDADRAFAADMLTGIVAQVQHGNDLEQERGQEACVVRLVPQIPIRNAGLPQSWLGGRPRLPEGSVWPEIDGAPTDFFAQIHCADLPADLWDGLGPRTGWLAFFVHPENYAVTVRHLEALGPAHSPPHPLRDADGWFAPHGGIRFGDLMPFVRRAFPEWPVDLIAVRPGDADPRVGESKEISHSLYQQGYDLADPAHHPFDWQSMLAMVDILEMRIDFFWKDIADGPSPLDDQLAKTEARLDTIEAEGEAEEGEVDRLTHQSRALRDLIAASREARTVNAAAKARAKEIIAIVRDSASSGAFSPDDAAAVMGALRAIRWMKVLRKADPEQRPGAEVIEAKSLSLTVHDPDATLWAHHYHSVHFDLAKHRYCAAPVALPEAARAFYEPHWQSIAAGEMAGMGHVPFHYVHDFDPADDVTLIELPSSGLMSWMFGDVDNLVLTMRRDDLAAGRFDAIKVQVSN